MTRAALGAPSQPSYTRACRCCCRPVWGMMLRCLARAHVSTPPAAAQSKYCGARCRKASGNCQGHDHTAVFPHHPVPPRTILIEGSCLDEGHLKGTRLKRWLAGGEALDEVLALSTLCVAPH